MPEGALTLILFSLASHDGGLIYSEEPEPYDVLEGKVQPIDYPKI